MTNTTEDLTTQSLSLTEELILMLLNEETGYFHQVPGWHLNCAVVGAVLAELSLRSRIDTDMESLLLLDETETGRPALDPILKEIAAEPVQRNAQYWIERLAPRAESIIDSVLNRLVDLKVLEYHDGEFYTLAHTGRHIEDTASEFIKLRIMRHIFTDAIPRSERCHHYLPRQYLRRLSFYIPARRRGGGAHRVHLQDESDRPLPRLCGLSEPRRPSPSTSCPCQEDSDGFAAQAAAEPA